MKNTLRLLSRRLASLRAEKRILKKTGKLIDRWIEEKGYCIDESMSDASERIGMSTAQLKYYFHNCVGKPFPTWRKEMRIREARRIIRNDPYMELAEVARSVGIKDVRNLRKHHDKLHRETLSEYRLRKRKTYSKFV